MNVGNKVKLVPSSFKRNPGESESIAKFWGIPKGAIGEIIGLSQHHLLIHWDKCKKPSFQDTLWHPSHLKPILTISGQHKHPGTTNRKKDHAHIRIKTKQVPHPR